MAEQPLQVRREFPKHKSMDYNFLKEEGIRLTQALSGKIWTDYNPHDPGVTILEQLCYALTDLGYRTDFKIQDILNARNKKNRIPEKNTFFDASEALPSNPVSVEDFRILLIDRIQHVKNAWAEPVRDNLQGIQGLYRIFLQVDESARTPNALRQIREATTVLFNQHRNLCEDLDSIQILGIDEIVIHADLDIVSDLSAEEALAKILFALEEYLNPSIKFSTTEELLEEGYGIDEIFEGPSPVHGIIKHEDLQPMRNEVYISKLIELISSVEGVRRITYFKVEKNGIAVEGDVIKIEPGNYPVLDMDTIDGKYSDSSNYPIQFFRGTLHYDLDLTTANQLLYSLYAKYKKGYQLKLLYREQDYPSVFKQEELPKYYSVQHTFPVTYGLNRYGLPESVRPTPERLAAVKQLKGYLLFFEQLMANYLAQLANVRKLFSIDHEVDKTYYAQVPTDIPGLGHLMKSRHFELDKQVGEFSKKLEEVVREFDPFYSRRNRILDHLLARFGEQFTTDFLMKVNSHITNNEDEEASAGDNELITAKIEFLQNWISVSRNRSKGFNYLGESLEQWNISGLEKRICLLLNMAQGGNESLLEFLYDEEDEGDSWNDVIRVVKKSTQEGFLELDGFQGSSWLNKDEGDFAEYLDNNDLDRRPKSEIFDEEDWQQGWAIGETKRETWGIEEETLDYTKKFVFRADSKKEALMNLLSNGAQLYNYIIFPTQGKNTYSVYYKGVRSLRPFKVREVSTELAARQELERLMAYIKRINELSEGIHMIEHVLLRPQAKDRHGFRLMDDQDNVLLMSYELGDLQTQRYASDEIPMSGGKRENYEVIQNDQEKYQAALKNDYGDYIAICPEPFYSKEGAEDKIQDIIDYVESFRNSKIPIYSNINFFVEQRKEASVEDGFYSLSLSMVMPNWPTRFQNSDFQKLIKNLVRVNAPVHIKVHFYWLDLDGMEKFEKSYFNWLKERLLIAPRQPFLDDRALSVVETLQELDDFRY